MSKVKAALDFHSISTRMQALKLPPIDIVVGIARGGIVPAAMVAHQLGAGLELLHLNYRDDGNKPRYPQPKLLQPSHLKLHGQRVLLVDDVSVTGATLALAKAQLEGAHITTLTCKGKADFVLFPEVAECVAWPWKVD